MRYIINIPFDGVLYSFSLGLYHDGDSRRIEVPGVVIFDLWRVHAHSYSLVAFFYSNKIIVSQRFYGTKKELYCAIQKLLQEYL